MSVRSQVLGALLIFASAAVPATAVAANAVEYIHTDALGSPVAVTDASGSLIERSEYEPYGAIVNPPDTDGVGYTGHVNDSATGLIYMQQRYYNPGLGRFLSADPVAGGANFTRYGYANNNPYRYIDPDGRCTGSHIKTSDGSCPGGGLTTESVVVRTVGPESCSDCGLARGEQQKPSFKDLAQNYPQGSAASVFEEIGGKVADNSATNGGTWENSCAVRICRALNRSGFPVSRSRGETVTGGDGMQYIYTVKVLEQRLTRRFGTPVSATMRDGLIDTTPFQGRRGIIIFDFGSGAGQGFTGHADLWNGYKCVGSCGPDYMFRAQRVLLWEMPE